MTTTSPELAIATSIADLAFNVWWSTLPVAQELFEALAPNVYASTRRNAAAVVRHVAPSDVELGRLDDPRTGVADDALATLLVERDLLDLASRASAAFSAYMNPTSTWFSRRIAAHGEASISADRPVAYFSAEFGLHASLPVYCGGLGVLAGDHTKAASDLGVPFVGVGLMYHEGYFRQQLARDGGQTAVYDRVDLRAIALRPARNDGGDLLTVSVPTGRGDIIVAARYADVGRVRVYFLDTHLDDNDAAARGITDRLYGGQSEERLLQEMVLGIGGVRFLDALGYTPAVRHLNEGHCAFASLEAIRALVAAGSSFDDARAEVVRHTAFTTHTPVPAGHDRFSPALVDQHLSWLGEELGLATIGLLELGRLPDVDAPGGMQMPEPGEDEDELAETARQVATVATKSVVAVAEGIASLVGQALGEEAEAEAPQAEPEPAPDGDELEGLVDDELGFAELNMTVLALNLSASAGGVSMVHGEVSRQMFGVMWPDRPASDVPIGHVTNGIHIPTWMSPIAREVWSRHLPDDWMVRRSDAEMWLEAAHAMSDEEILDMRRELKHDLMVFVRDHVAKQRKRWGVATDTSNLLDAEALTIGFARRFATYKRAGLIFTDLERAAALFSDEERPLQLLFAGKAHPNDTAGQAVIEHLAEVAKSEPFAGRVFVLEDYDMNMGRALVSGVDVWLNNPRRPREASGTSGQKVAMHGGLNCSVLDGWWPEGFDGLNGFAIGDAVAPASPELQDLRDAGDLYRVLEREVIPLFYDRPEGVPRRWLTRVRLAMSTCIARFSTWRMVQDYTNLFYLPLS